MKNQIVKKKYIIHKYTVVGFHEETGDRLFECLPDLWFVDDDLRNSCYFPPKTGKPYMQRAINCEKPEDNWSIHECTVVKSGFLTYHAGFELVKEKCAQRYNTSSAEEEIQKANFRRQHPGLIGEGIEHVFPKFQPKMNDNLINKENTKVSTEKRKSCENSTTNDVVDVRNNSLDEPENTQRKKSLQVKETNAAEEKSNGSAPLESKSYRGRSKSQSSTCSIRSKQSSSSCESIRSSTSSDVVIVDKRQRQRKTESLIDNANGSEGNSKRRSTSKSSVLSSKSDASRRSSHRSRSKQSSSGSNVGRSKSRSSIRSSKSSGSRQRSRSSCSTVPRSHRSRSNNFRSPSQRSSRSRSKQSRSRRSSSVDTSRSRSHKSTSKRKHSRSRSSSRSSSRRNHSVSHKRRRRSVSIQPRPSNRSQLARLNSEHRSYELPKQYTSQRVMQRANGKSSKRIVPKDVKSVNKSKTASHEIGSPVHKLSANSHRTQPSRQNSLTTTSSSNNSVNDLISTVKELTKAVELNNEKLTQNDRRLNRLEVTINKIFVTLGDMNGNIRIPDEIDDHGFDVPDLPISSKTELAIVHRKLKDKEFRKFWLIKEKDYCCPSKSSTENGTVTKYLKRFISVNVRCQMTLMEAGESGLTLHGNYRQVYLFLIDLIKAGYRSCNKTIRTDEAHTALRVVWGRSKQLKNNSNQKK